MYDAAVIGAGINGSSVVYELTQAGKEVILFDGGGIAAGGSGAAGAFISPKFSKAGELKEILHDAFLYSMEFYATHFPECFTRTELLHIAKDANDAESLRLYKERTTLPLKDLTSTLNESVSIDAGIVDAKRMCEALSKYAKFIKEDVETLRYEDSYWVINETFSAKEVILATGAYKPVIQEPYIELRGVWGHRIDVETATANPYSLHQFVSISPSKEGVVAIGATHNVHYHPQNATEPYNIEQGRAELLEKANRTLILENIKIVRDYMGLRSGSFDYMPLVGELVLSSETLANKDIRFKVKKPDYSEYSYYPNLYMINGSGGYGFVLAPYLAKILVEHIINDAEISKRLLPARFFARWVKKQ